ncbi:MAG TPA: Xaa-Pro peptidase family protein [Thermoanaerobaculia bacterium]|nr:Xaa-Pro peptidase family protein [Thermoanaerobaculia bacterium]
MSAPPGVSPGRLERLASGLEELECSALLVLAGSARDPDMAPFAGPVHVHSCFVLGRRGQSPLFGYLTPMEREEAAATGLELLTPEALDVARWARQGAGEERLLAEVLSQGLLLAQVAPGTRLALAGRTTGAGIVAVVTRRLEELGWSLVPAHDLLRRLRKAKSEPELDAVRHAARGASAALRRVAELLAATVERDGELWLQGERLRVARLRREVASSLATAGLEQPEGNIVAPGAQGATPHSAGRDESVLRAAETLVVDLFPRGCLFADCARTFCAGAVPAAVEEAHRAVLDVLGRAHRALAPGARGWDLQAAACARLGELQVPNPVADPGTTRGYVHGLGHGVGYELHEYPSFRRHAGDEGVLEVGDVLTLEPGIYEPAAGFGVRLEDLVWLGPDGVEILTPLPYDLDPRAWA